MAVRRSLSYFHAQGFLWGRIEATKFEYTHPGMLLGSMPSCSVSASTFFKRLEVSDRGKVHFADVETEAQRGARDLPSRAALMVKGAREPLCLPLGIDRGPWLDPFPSALQLVLPGALATCPLPTGTGDIRRELCPHPQVRGCSVKTLQCVGRMSPVLAWLGPRARAPCLGNESLSVHAR